MPDRSATPLRPLLPQGGLKPAVLALAVATAFGALPPVARAQTLPSGGVAVHGQAVITQPAANRLQVVTQNGAGTSHSAINWQSFSISQGATATIQQPHAASLSINRVVTNTPSAIFGNLSSNGRLVLVNQSGIAVGAGAVIDTAGFTASALRMSDADALAGRLRFGEPGASMGGAAGLTVGGTITAREGDIVLVAPNIDLGTSALLKAPNGSTILAAGQQVEITGRGLEGITMLVQAPADQARNLGRLEGSAVGIFAGTLRHSGEIQATTASLEGGTVVLRAAGDAYVEGAGSVDATGTRGGKVDVLGSRVAVMDQAVVDVSGDTGGGQIRIGGDYQGKNPGIPNAQKTFLGPEATLRADATASGDGGRVIVWSDDYTQAHGAVSARGGLSGGNGGFVEVSGKRSLAFTALVDTRAPRGLTGTLLLDPDFIDIDVSGSSYAGDVLFSDGSGLLTLSAATINASFSNVVLQANEDINFNTAVSLTNPGVSLTASAGGFLTVNGSITTKGGAVTLTAGDPNSVTSPNEGSLNLNQPIDTTGGGAFPAGAPVTLTSSLADVGGNSVFINNNINAGTSAVTLDAQFGGPVDLAAGTIIAGDLDIFANFDISQTGGSITASGITAIDASNVSLTRPGNNFNVFGGIANTVSVTDTNGITLGSSSFSQLTVNANGNVSQNAAVIVGGTTSISAGIGGNVTLTLAGNNLNQLNVSGNALNIVEGAGSSLTVLSLSSGFNQPVSLAAGHTLTLPGTAINTGTANLTLSSAIGPLTIPAALNGNNISLSAVTGLTVNAPITATGDFTATVSGGGSTMTVNRQVSAGADMALTLAGNLSVLASASGAAGLTAAGDQTIAAGGNILLQGGASGNSNRASIQATGSAGTQSVTANGITLLGGNGSFNSASIKSAGFQEVTVGNGGIAITGGGGSQAGNLADIDHVGPVGTHQLITVNGTGSISLQGGAAAGGDSEASIRSEFGDSQTVTFTGGGAGRTITLVGGTVGTDSYAEIWVGAGTQLITGAGQISLTGGASGGGLSFGGGDLLGNVAVIAADSNDQTIVASGIAVQGGAAGLNNLAAVFGGGDQSITVGAGGLFLAGGSGGGSDLKNAAIVWKGSDVPGTTQTITVGGSGSVTLQGGSASRQNVGTDADFAGLSNGAFAAIRSEGTAQLIEFTAPSGSIQLAGGTVGSDNHAFIFAQAGTQTIRGATSAQAPTISATGGASGGLANEGNRAAIIAEAGNQVISAASIALQGGAAGTENVAQIRQGSVSTGLSSTQVIDIVTSATSALQGGGGSTNLARIQAYGTAQTVGLATGSNLNLSGGTGASFNFARIEALNGDQTITGSGAISVVGGASGGASGQGNFADIRSRGTSNTQSISARSLTIAGGAGGIENDASVRADGDQTVSLQTSGSNALVIGNAGAAHASSLTGNNQTVTAGSGSQSGSITIVGGTAAGKSAGIFANVVTPNPGTQTISTTGSLSLTGGTATGTSTCDAASSGACADIANDGSGLQTITANAVQMQGGASGIANGAGIFQRGGDLLLTVGAGGLTMTGGSGGSNNFATIGGSNANGSTLTLDVTGNIVMDALNATTGSGALIGLGGVGSGNSVTIDVTASGALTLRGSDVAATGSAIGANNTQTASTTNISIDAASVSMLGGSAGPARIGSAPLLPGGGDISVIATGAVSLQGAVAGNAVIHTLGRVDVEGSTLDIRNTVSGNEVSLLGTAGVSLSGAASVNANASGTALKVIVDTGAFSNTAGASALLAPNGRWLVYSVDPANDTRGSLAHDFKQYDAVPGDSVLGIGNGLLYSLPAPSITATLVGVVSKTYDGTDVATLSAGNYSATGIDGDVIQLNNPSTGTYDTKAIGTGKSVVAGSLSLVSVVDASGKPVFGYNPTVSPAGGLVGEITAASITAVTGITAANKVYDATPSATLVTSGAVFAGKAAGDNLVLSSATGTFDTKDVGTGKTVTVTGLGLSGTDAGNYILSATSATTTGNITPATISGITGITAANKVYDGDIGAILTTSGAAFTGRLGSDVLSVATAVGNFSDKNVANPKTVNITGLSLGGTDAGNYTLASTTATTAAAITPATITAVAGLSATKVYDGNSSATALTSGATFTGAFSGDTLTVTASSASFSDRNVGTGKVLTASGLTLGGTDAGNYSLAAASATGTGTITQRPVSTWTGGGGDGLWSNPLNWDALPDGSNVAAASIPAGAGTVIFNGAVAATSLQTLSALSPFTMAGSSLSVSSTMAVEDFGQGGGALGGTGSLVVTNSFSQGGGSIAMGNITIVQNAGNLSFSNISGNTVALVAPGGSISQSGPLVASTLTTSSGTGTALSLGSNQIANLYAENLGSGDITVANTGPMNLLGLDNTGGNIAVSTNGPMSAFGPVTASGSVTLAANGSGGNLGIFAPVTAGSQVVLSAADTLTQDAAVLGTNGVTADAGVSIVFGAFATANYSPVVYRVNSIVAASPPTEVAVGSELQEVMEQQAEAIIEIGTLLAVLSDPIPAPEASDFNPKGEREEPTDDSIVTEGEVCK